MPKYFCNFEFTTGAQLLTYYTRTRNYIRPLIIKHEFCRKCIRFEDVNLENKIPSEIINEINTYSLEGFIDYIIDYIVEQFQNILENLSSLPGELFILDEIRLHLDSQSNYSNTFFLDLLSSFGLRQHVDFPTRIHGHWLDLFITRTACDLIKTVYTSYGLSDHMTVIADVGVKLVSHTINKCFFHTDVLKAYLYQIFFRY